jgi:hypothetical protein
MRRGAEISLRCVETALWGRANGSFCGEIGRIPLRLVAGRASFDPCSGPGRGRGGQRPRQRTWDAFKRCFIAAGRGPVPGLRHRTDGILEAYVAYGSILRRDTEEYWGKNYEAFFTRLAQ